MHADPTHLGACGQAGGSAAQLDLARDAGAAVGNGEARYWRMQNGYLLPDRPSGLAQLAGRLRGEKGLAESVRDSLRVGVHLGGNQGRWGRPARNVPASRWPRVAGA